MEMDYKGHEISVITNHSPDLNGWKLRVQVTEVTKGGGTHVVPFRTSQMIFATKQEAEEAGLSLAKQWIDNGKAPLMP
jgi:hypothetical protein